MKKFIQTVLVLAALLTPTLMQPAAVFAACPGPSDTTSKDQVLKGIGETGTDCSEGGVTKVISEVVKILSFIVGIVAIIMVIVSGLRYVTSAGDSNKAASARSTLIYALIGIVIAALAQVLVRLVLNNAEGSIK